MNRLTNNRGKKLKEHPPTDQELANSIDALFVAAHQSALFAYWSLIRQPLLRKLSELGIPEAEPHFSSGILESSLMLIRKTTEFFRARDNQDRPDNLYAYQYLPNLSSASVVDEKTYRELHKRVGHLTVRETRHGQMNWPILPMTISALDQWILFFRDVVQSPVFQGNPPTDRLNEIVVTLAEISEHCKKLNLREERH